MFKHFAVITGLMAAMISGVLASDVLTVTDSSLDSTIKDNQFVLMEFYAPWCKFAATDDDHDMRLTSNPRRTLQESCPRV
jgi:hypothetical protein